jgi:hypothetical protein
MSDEDRSERVIRFLMGLRDAGVAHALKGRGFTEDDRRQGYRLLEAQTEGSLDAPAPAPSNRTELLARLDAWENEWYPIAFASLRSRFPAVHEHVFRNLGQTSGLELVIYVDRFVSRLDQLEASGVDGATDALALLAQRGLTAAVIADGRARLDALVGPLPAPEPESAPTPEELARRDAALWDYYLEWSAIARVAIKEPRLLRKLGFGTRGRPKRPATSDEGSGDAG